MWPLNDKAMTGKLLSLFVMGALGNPESHTFGLPIVGGPGSLLPQCTGVRACMLESDPGWSSVSVSSSSAAVSSLMTNRSYTSTLK